MSLMQLVDKTPIRTAYFVILEKGSDDAERKILDQNLELISVQRGYYPPAVDPIASMRPSLGLWALAISSELPKDCDRGVALYHRGRGMETLMEATGEPQVFFVSCMSSLLDVCRECIWHIRQAHPAAVVLVGGAHATFCPDSLMDGRGSPDLIWQGEADGQVMRAIGLARSNAAAGKCSVVSSDCSTHALTAPDWAFHLEYADNVERIMPRMLLSRDCIHRCAFCTPRGDGSRIRERRTPLACLKSQTDAYRALLGSKQVHFRFSDPDFLWDRDWASQVFDALEPLHVSWDCQTRVPRDLEHLKNQLPRMREIGCRSLFFGIESRDQRVLQSIGKIYPCDNIQPAIEACKSAGVMALCNLIAGLPGQTEESAMRDVEWACGCLASGTLGCVDLQFLQLMPGTAIQLNPEKYGVSVEPNFSWACVDEQVQHSTRQMPRAKIAGVYEWGISRLNRQYEVLLIDQQPG